MNQPPLDLLLQKVGNKYSLVVKTAKMARKMTEEEVVTDENGHVIKGKPVTLALYEIAYNSSESA
jgi:DNA-directed RNA polymerase omega subunit